MFKKLFLNDRIILVFILLNSFLIFLSGFDTYTQQQIYIIRISDNFFSLIFIIELIVKIKTYSFSQYIKSNWNKFDFLLIVLSIPALISFSFNLDLSNLSFFLVFRIFRVFKFFRFLKFIPGIKGLLSGVQRALKSSFVVILGFSVYIFIMGVLSSFILKDIAPSYFSNPIESFYSIFKIFTLEGWYEIPEEITKNTSKTVSLFINAYFIFLLVTGGVFGLSLVNSIFVDAMLTDNTDDISRKIDRLESKIEDLKKSKEH